jgi:hypothetical protein
MVVGGHELDPFIDGRTRPHFVIHLRQGEKEDAVSHHRVRIVVELRLVDVGPQERERIVVVDRQALLVAVVDEVDVSPHVVKGQVEMRQEEGVEVVLVWFHFRKAHPVDEGRVVVSPVSEMDGELARQGVVHDVLGQAVEVVRVAPLRAPDLLADMGVRESREAHGISAASRRPGERREDDDEQRPEPRFHISRHGNFQFS